MYIQPLLWCHMFLLFLVSSEFYWEWMSSFVEGLFWIYWDDPVSSGLYVFMTLIYVLQNLSWTVYLEPTLHFWNKTTWFAMVCDILKVFFILICNKLIEKLALQFFTQSTCYAYFSSCIFFRFDFCDRMF